ncbi:hypothetical protein Lser_V15G26752 [Lactuca serriola]
MIILLKVESDNTVTSVCSLEAEFARLLWVFGMNSYEIFKEHKNLIACSYRILACLMIMPNMCLFESHGGSPAVTPGHETKPHVCSGGLVGARKMARKPPLGMFPFQKK